MGGKANQPSVIEVEKLNWSTVKTVSVFHLSGRIDASALELVQPHKVGGKPQIKFKGAVNMTRKRKWLKGYALVVVSVMAISATAAAAEKPNILVIFGDDVGQTNISAYSMGVVGYKTPNIDRIAKEGMMFTDYYAENSCTAGRSSFITGQTPLRTGLTKVGMPGSTVGLQKRDITIAQALKSQGYATGQFGKNHLGDRDEYLPTAHGFDEFFGNLYHLNAE